MRVLVTGAAGFVGRELVPILARDHEVIATDLACQGLAELGAADSFEGDVADGAVRRCALRGADAVVHLATVPGGAAEENPQLAQKVNVEAAMALSTDLAALKPGAPFIFASSIAVFGHPLPGSVDDDTPLAPVMRYGAHKAMIEQWLAALSRRGELSPLSLRLPGIVARPRTRSGMKSAFMSDLFHAVRGAEEFVLPVSPAATMWLMSVRQVAKCLAQALTLGPAEIPASRAVTLPALRVRMDALVQEVCRQCSQELSLVRYAADAALEDGFGRQPPLTTRTADHLGFRHDCDVRQLVRSALETLQ